jgi:hypothetical protein
MPINRCLVSNFAGITGSARRTTQLNRVARAQFSSESALPQHFRTQAATKYAVPGPAKSTATPAGRIRRALGCENAWSRDLEDFLVRANEVIDRQQG